MRHNENVIHLGGDPPEWLAAALAAARPDVRMMPGTVLVEMDDERERVGSIVLTDEGSGKLRPDMGTVIQRAWDVPLLIGDRVLVAPYAGKWMANFRAGEYRSKGQVRFYGRLSTMGEDARIVNWHEQVRAVMVGTELRPTGRNVLIRRPELSDKVGNIYLPDVERYREPVATVLETGPLCIHGLEPGERVIILNGAMKRTQLSGVDYGGDPDLALIHEDGILCVVEGDEQVDPEHLS